MDKVKIKVAKIGRKQMPSKFKEGETYNITTVMDELTGRKGVAMGAFADNWKVGDTVEGIWEEKTWVDKDGFEQKSWNIKNPDKKEFKGGGGSYGPRKATLMDAYSIAASLAPVLFKDKATVKFADIVALAEVVMKKIEVSAAIPAAPAPDKVKTVDLDTEEKVGNTNSAGAKAASDFDVDVADDVATDSVDDDTL